jgi:hypothetical protein
MLLGHFAVALAAKRAAPRTSLGALFIAAQFLDLAWPIFLLAGLERVRIVPGLMAASPLVFVHYPLSHSLLAALGWAALAGLAYFALRRDRRGAGVIAALVASHWFLDAPMHRPDLPLWPGSSILVGGGLWNSLPATLAIELCLLAAGLLVYLRATDAERTIGRWGPWGLAALLLAVFLSGFVAAPPPNERALAAGAMGLWIFVALGFWIDGAREAVEPALSVDGSGGRSPDAR